MDTCRHLFRLSNSHGLSVAIPIQYGPVSEALRQSNEVDELCQLLASPLGQVAVKNARPRVPDLGPRPWHTPGGSSGDLLRANRKPGLAEAYWYWCADSWRHSDLHSVFSRATRQQASRVSSTRGAQTQANSIGSVFRSNPGRWFNGSCLLSLPVDAWMLRIAGGWQRLRSDRRLHRYTVGHAWLLEGAAAPPSAGPSGAIRRNSKRQYPLTLPSCAPRGTASVSVAITSY